MKPVVDADHGRIETRTTAVTAAIAWLADHGWPGLEAIGEVVCRREIGDATSAETAHHLLSTPLSPERLNEVARLHRGAESRPHWRLDLVMNEDQDRIRRDNGPHTIAVLRHVALNAMHKEGSRGSLRGEFKRARWDEAFQASSPRCEMRFPALIRAMTHARSKIGIDPVLWLLLTLRG